MWAGDILARGDESTLRSPLADFLVLAASADLRSLLNKSVFEAADAVKPLVSEFTDRRKGHYSAGF
ncbi:MAG: DUF1152 domain-containing protein [Egibacteraceae bacterium]